MWTLRAEISFDICLFSELQKMQIFTSQRMVSSLCVLRIFKNQSDFIVLSFWNDVPLDFTLLKKRGERQCCKGLYSTRQAPLSMEFSRQEFLRGLPFPTPGNLPIPGIEPNSPTLEADSLPSEPPGKPF